MDLLSEIIRLNQNASSALRNKYYKKLNNLNLKDKCLHTNDFLALTENGEILGVIKDFLSSILCQKDIHELSKSILFAYHFTYRESEYQNPIFKKMIQIAKELVNELDNFSSDDKIIRLIDNYFAHFSIWNTMTEYEKIEDKFEVMTTFFFSYHKLKSLNNDLTPLLNQLLLMFEELRSKNNLFVIEGLLQRYNLVYGITELTVPLWQDINDYYLSSPDHCLIIMCIELRFHLLNNATNPESKRELFYDIDPESLLDIARKGSINSSEINKIINIFQTIILRDNFILEQYNDSFNDVVNFFRSAFNSIAANKN